MTRFHKITLGIFCGGILLAGIGAGISFGEFSGMSYGGEETVGAYEKTTREISREIDPERGVWRIGRYWGEEMEPELDDSVPENTVVFRITYNAEQVDPEVKYVETEYEDGEEGPALEIWADWYGSDNELKDMMEAKDKVLAGLRRGELISIKGAPGIEKVEIRINPANRKDIRIF